MSSESKIIGSSKVRVECLCTKSDIPVTIRIRIECLCAECCIEVPLHIIIQSGIPESSITISCCQSTENIISDTNIGTSSCEITDSIESESNIIGSSKMYQRLCSSTAPYLKTTCRSWCSSANSDTNISSSIVDIIACYPIGSIKIERISEYSTSNIE